MPSYVNPQVDHNLYGTLIPQFPTEMAAKLLQNRQQKYDIGLAAVRSKTSSMLDMESKMLSPYMKKTVSDYNKQVNEKLQKFSTADFSIQSNVDAVSSLYDPLMKDELFLQEYMTSIGKSRTEQHIYEMATSDDEDVRAGYHDNNYAVWKNKYDTLENADSYNEAVNGVKKAAGAMYTPYYDPSSDFKELVLKSDIISITEDVTSGEYIITYKNGTRAVRTASQLATLSLSDRAKTQFRINAEADMLRTGSDDAYLQAIQSTLPALDTYIYQNEKLISDNKDIISKLGDTEQSIQKKKELELEINAAQSNVEIYQSQKNRFSSLAEKYKTGNINPQDLDMMKQVAINSLAASYEDKFISEWTSFFANRNTELNIKKNDAYFGLMEEERLRQKLNGENGGESDTPIGTSVSTGLIDIENLDNSKYIDNLRRDVLNGKSMMNSKIMDKYFELDGLYSDFYEKVNNAIQTDEKLLKGNDSQKSKYKGLKNKKLIDLYNDGTFSEINEFLSEVKIRSEKSGENNDFYKTILESKLSDLITENTNLRDKDGNFLSPENFKNPFIKGFLKDYQLYNTSDGDVTIDKEKTKLYSQYDNYFEETTRKEQLIEKLKETEEYKRSNEEIEKLTIDYQWFAKYNTGFNLTGFLSAYHIGNDLLLTDFMKQDHSGEWVVDNEKIKTSVDEWTDGNIYLANPFSNNTGDIVDTKHEKWKANMVNNLTNKVQSMRDKAYDKGLDKALAKNPNLAEERLYQKQSIVYTGEEARKFMNQSEIGAELIANLGNMAARLGSGTEGLKTDASTPVITSPWFKKMDEDEKAEAIRVIQYMVSNGVYSSVVARGDGTLDLTYSGSVTVKDKGETQDVTTNIKLYSDVFENNPDAQKAVKHIISDGVRLDNIGKLSEITETNPIMASMMKKPRSTRSLIGNASKSFDVKITSRKDAMTDGFNFDIRSTYQSIGGISKNSQVINLESLLTNINNGESITSAVDKVDNYSLQETGMLTEKEVTSTMEDFIERQRKIYNFVNTKKGKERFIELLQTYISGGEKSMQLLTLENIILQEIPEE